MDDWKWGAFVSAFLLGGILGALTFGNLTSKYGRRRVLLYNNIFFLLGGFLFFFANNFLLLWVGRFLLGLGCGAGTVVLPIFISEISPTSIRGSMGSVNQLSIVFGVFLSQTIGVVMSTKDLWRLFFGLTLVPAILQIILLPYCVESPKWLIHNNYYAEAKKALQTLRKTDSIDEEYSLILSQSGISSSSEPATNYDENSSLLPISPHALQSLSIPQLFSSQTLRLPVLLSLSLHVAQQFSGINAAIYYSTTIFEQSYSRKTALVLTLLVSFINLIMMIPSMYLIEKAGRKKLLLISMLWMALLSAFIAVAGGAGWNKEWIVVGLVGFVAGFGIGLGAIPWLILPELLPTQAVGAAGSVCTAVNWTCNFLVAFFLPAFISFG
ncbi:Solute carrier 2, facilitated glucose transporter member 3 [Nowakowskiella sp. JEL0078]|nr:Solute carrier 2, facilitated glucose transporter member 3 [Nowakowskiella sp. JEL0078]